jgi:hypothetical protein
MRLVPRRTGAYAALLLLMTSLGGFASPLPASAAPITVRPDVARLPVGALPALPYVDWPARRIVDGDQRVSISGIQGRVIELHKVDGGYLLRRRVPSPAEYDLVFVSNRGVRKVLASGVLGGKLPVSRHGDTVIINVGTDGGITDSYVETRVLALPGGQLLRRRDFGSVPPGLYGFGINRALILTADRTSIDTFWWTPSSDSLELLRPDASIESADLSAWDWAVRPQDGSDPYSVQGLPPHTAPNWRVDEQDINLTAWSLDDTKIVGNNERTEGDGEISSTAYLVHRASDGAQLLVVLNESPSQATWETDNRVLLRTKLPESSPRTYQLIRCTLSGSCSRVGPRTTEVDGAIIPATRRNS